MHKFLAKLETIFSVVFFVVFLRWDDMTTELDMDDFRFP